MSGREVGAGGTGNAARVLIVDDHRTFSELLMFALDGEPDFDCVGVAASATEAVEATQRLRPDIVVLDIQMPRQDGLTAARQIRELLPDTIITVLSAHQESEWVVRAAQAGVNGYVTKDGSLPDMLDVLRRVRLGTMLTAPGVFARAGRVEPAADGTAAPVSLTDRERDVLAHMGQGMPPKSIARVLGISLHTCRGYVKSIHSKLGVRSQLEAVVRAQRLGIIERPDAD
ncbi:MAG TPA: response regulator transcription factor [Mycobacteriales bacterium]|nr:response regulator transcription factor [Mycobacteriales bacterium]